jgi:hypothetical protein
MKKYLVGLSIMLFVCMVAGQATAQIKHRSNDALTVALPQLEDANGEEADDER